MFALRAASEAYLLIDRPGWLRLLLALLFLGTLLAITSYLRSRRNVDRRKQRVVDPPPSTLPPKSASIRDLPQSAWSDVPSPSDSSPESAEPPPRNRVDSPSDATRLFAPPSGTSNHTDVFTRAGRKVTVTPPASPVAARDAATESVEKPPSEPRSPEPFTSTSLPPMPPPLAGATAAHRKSTDHKLERVRPISHSYFVRIFYATDREQNLDDEQRVSYRTNRDVRGTLHFGTCDVSIPGSHKIGKLESPHWWKLEFGQNPLKHVVLLQVTAQSAEDFFWDVKERTAESEKQDILVFVHGFDVLFEEAARRTAQLAFDLRFQGAAILYSWPSEGSVHRYSADEETVNWTAPHLKSFLEEVALKSGAQTIHLVAHSMGNRALVRAITEMSIEDCVAQFQQVILTAPDIDSGEFLQLANAIQSKASRVTLYASSRDKAILASKLIHKYPRAGEAGEDLIVVPGIDTVDATNVDTGLLCHSYYGSERTVISDMFYLIGEGKPPHQRHGLTERSCPRGSYWAFLE
jgi:esterase/lipase superfamily enzyme